MISTTFRCCGSDITINADSQKAGAYRCPTCGDYLWGHVKGSIYIDERSGDIGNST